MEGLKDNDELKKFGQQIRKIRNEQNKTLQEVANLAEIELSQVYRIESGKINPKLTTILILAKALAVKPSVLLEEFPA